MKMGRASEDSRKPCRGSSMKYWGPGVETTLNLCSVTQLVMQRLSSAYPKDRDITGLDPQMRKMAFPKTQLMPLY